MGAVSPKGGEPLAPYFRNRREAGRVLARLLGRYHGRNDTCVLALPRGGVPVGYEVSVCLGLPLDVFVVRKLGVPGHEELAMGAIASGGLVVRNSAVVEMFAIDYETLERVIERERAELERREREYGGAARPNALTGRVVIVVDDGLATGSSMRAAVIAFRKARASRVVVAVPAAAPDTCEELRAVADEVVCAVTPEPFFAVGAWYEDFAQTTDREVKELLTSARELCGGTEHPRTSA
jgi:putative phosphoribosyl transferase